MNQKEFIFDNLMKNQGGIYIPSFESEYDNLQKWVLELADKLIADLRLLNPKLPSVSTYLVNNNDEINACAFKNNADYYIAINTAVITNLKQIFETIFNSANIYDNGEFFIENKEEYINKCLYYSMSFLIIHEYSHIRFGHCGLIEHLWGTSITELNSDALFEEGIFRQTLEFDADCCTVANITNRILRENEKNIESASENIQLCVLSCYVLFKIFDNGRHSNYERYDLDNLAQSTHPRPGMRQNYIFANIITVLLRHWEKKDVDYIVNKGWSYIIAFEKTLNKDFSLNEVEIGINYTRKGNEHYNLITNNWEKVREMLLPFTHDSLAPFERVNFTPKLID